MDPEADRVWKALGDPTRRTILDLLAGRPCTTGELCQHFAAGPRGRLCRTGVMKHLDILEKAGELSRAERRAKSDSLAQLIGTDGSEEVGHQPLDDPRDEPPDGENETGRQNVREERQQAVDQALDGRQEPLELKGAQDVGQEQEKDDA